MQIILHFVSLYKLNTMTIFETLAFITTPDPQFTQHLVECEICGTYSENKICNDCKNRTHDNTDTDNSRMDDNSPRTDNQNITL